MGGTDHVLSHDSMPSARTRTTNGASIEEHRRAGPAEKKATVRRGLSESRGWVATRMLLSMRFTLARNIDLCPRRGLPTGNIIVMWQV